MINQLSKVLFTGLVLFTMASCEDALQKNDAIAGKTRNGHGSHPGDIKSNPGDSYRYPEIIEREYVPPYDLFSEYKCRTWRIAWPDYADDFDSDFIPTVLSLNNGELNSFNFLNNTHPNNTFNGTISLFYSQRVQSAHVMWPELDYVGDGVMENVTFAPGNVSLDKIMDWVQERPDLFINHWPEIGTYNELDYEEGDFIHFKLLDSKLYGGIRIVSLSPRIIEVYLTLPK